MAGVFSLGRFTHVDGIRDSDHPCDTFRNGRPSGQCDTDGHYVCHECKHANPRTLALRNFDDLTPAQKQVLEDEDLDQRGR